MLMSPEQWIENTFAEGSRPHIRTVRRWIANGELQSKKIGGSVYIEDTQFANRECQIENGYKPIDKLEL